MRKASWVLVVLLSLVGSSCRKKTWAPYYQLDGQQSVLVARDGEGAYESPEMDTIITALNAAPENAKEREQALALATRLSAARDRVKAERAAVQDTVVVGAAPVMEQRREVPTPKAPPPAPTQPTAEAIDAGPSYPAAGMSLEAFTTAFGTCFTAGPAVKTREGKSATSQQVKPEAACLSRYAAGEKATSEVLFLFADGKLVGTRITERTQKSETITVPPKQTEPIIIDAGVVGVLVIPGMPTAAPEPEPKKP
jgi:hypothetical protein